MALTLNGSTGLSGIVGSAGTPALQGTDTNTGYFFGTDILGLSTGGTERLRITSTGHLGLNVIPGSWDTTFIALEGGGTSKHGALHFQANGDWTTSLGCNNYYNSGWKYRHAGGASWFEMKEDTFKFSLANSGSADGAITWSEKFRIASDGKVGIGTTSPRSVLDVFEVTTGNQTAIRIGNTNTPSSANDKRLEFVDGTGTTEGTNKFTYGYIQGLRAGGANSGDLIFGTKRSNAAAPVEAMRIDDSGNVGIGTTSPTGKLNVVGVSGTNPTVQINHSNADVTGEFLRLARTDIPTIRYHSLMGQHGGGATANFITFKLHNGSTTTSQSEVLSIIGNGNVKITDGDLQIGTDGHGIDFSATGGPASGTGGSELLDDYEEGTFSPGWFDDGGNFVTSYSTQYGQYTKIGNVVYFCFGLRIGTFSRTPNADQICRVGNLPYVSREVGDDQECVFNLYARLWGSGTPPETARIRQSSGSGSNHVEFFMDESQTGNDHTLKGEDFDSSATCRVIVNGFYYTS